MIWSAGSGQKALGCWWGRGSIAHLCFLQSLGSFQGKESGDLGRHIHLVLENDLRNLKGGKNVWTPYLPPPKSVTNSKCSTATY